MKHVKNQEFIKYKKTHEEFNFNEIQLLCHLSYRLLSAVPSKPKSVYHFWYRKFSLIFPLFAPYKLITTSLMLFYVSKILFLAFVFNSPKRTLQNDFVYESYNVA